MPVECGLPPPVKEDLALLKMDQVVLRGQSDKTPSFLSPLSLSLVYTPQHNFDLDHFYCS